MRGLHIVRGLVLIMAMAAGVAAAAPESAMSPTEQAKLLESLAPHAVVVEYTLKYDSGEAPRGGVSRYLCPNCGNYHTTETGARYVEQERPLESGGFLVGPTTVIAPDVTIESRFIAAIHVRQGEHKSPAKITGHGVGQDMCVLEIQRPLPKAKPLTFTAAAGPYLAMQVQEGNGMWTHTLTPLPQSVSLSPGVRRYIAAPNPSLIVDKTGKPVTLWMAAEMPLDDTWKTPPLEREMLTAESLTGRLKNLADATATSIPLVRMNFRSPRAKPGDSFGRDFGDDDEEGSQTERFAPAVVFEDGKVLVLASLKPAQTARLDRISLIGVDGSARQAKFVGTLRDYGAFVAQLASAPTSAVNPSATPLLELRGRLLLRAEIKAAGEERIARFGHTRLGALSTGWRGNLYPEAGDPAFLFDAEGRLAALPVAARKRAASADDRWDQPQPLITAVSQLKAVLANLPGEVDATNVPLSEEEESRIAWMGAEFQPLDRELARANKVADQTQDGRIGALVTYVYPDSPAAKAGIEPGAILLRLHVAGMPKPLEVQMRDDAFDMRQAFPWDRLDEVPEVYFDRIPQPWPPAETSLNRMLTDLGFGTEYAAEFAINGATVRKPMTVVQSPTHYDGAPRYKSGPIGVTVRDLTYEVRRHLQKAANDPGVVIAKVEPGSRASVAGVKPFELITHVNDQPVRDVKEFEKAVAGAPAEVRLSVSRMHRARQVRLTMDKDLPGKAAQPAPKTDGVEDAPRP